MVRPTYSRAINRPKLVFGVEKRTLIVGSLAGFITMFLLNNLWHHGFWVSLGCSLGLAASIFRIMALYTKRDPQMVSCRARAIFHPASYDPGKFRPFRVLIKK